MIHKNNNHKNDNYHLCVAFVYKKLDSFSTKIAFNQQQFKLSKLIEFHFNV